MKKFTFIIIGIFISIQSFSQQKDTSYWDKGGITSLTFSQTNYKYWSAGGNNSITINSLLNAHANYKKDNIAWQNSLELGYGTQKSMGLPFRKTDDKINFSSNFGFKAENNLYYTALLGFISQFADGYKYLDNGDSAKISAFMAPAYLIYSLGINYIPNKNFSLYSSLLTGKTTFVLDKKLSAIGAFGVDTGKSLRYEFGAYLKMIYNKKLTKNFTLNTNLSLFSNYLKNPQNIDVNFNLLASYKIAKFITLNFQLQAIYDDDILILVDPATGRMGKRLQLQEIIGVGLAYNF
jgi:hypothetical protein